MAKKLNLNFFIIITFFALIFVPSKLPGILKMPGTIGVASICILLQVIGLIRTKSDPQKFKESIILLLVTIVLFAVYLFI